MAGICNACGLAFTDTHACTGTYGDAGGVMDCNNKLHRALESNYLLALDRIKALEAKLEKAVEILQRAALSSNPKDYRTAVTETLKSIREAK